MGGPEKQNCAVWRKRTFACHLHHPLYPTWLQHIYIVRNKPWGPRAGMVETCGNSCLANAWIAFFSEHELYCHIFLNPTTCKHIDQPSTRWNMEPKEENNGSLTCWQSFSDCSELLVSGSPTCFVPTPKTEASRPNSDL